MIPPPLKPFFPMTRRTLTRREWWFLVGLPRLLSPVLIVSLLYTTHWQIWHIFWRDDLWLNVPIFLMGFSAIVLQLKNTYENLTTWTWHGEMRLWKWPKTIFWEDQQVKAFVVQDIKEQMLRKLGIRNYPGYMGAFTRTEVLGAWRNGTIVTKVQEEPGDATPLGTDGVVLGSMFNSAICPHVMYFIEWADRPKFAISVLSWKIAPKPIEKIDTSDIAEADEAWFKDAKLKQPAGKEE